MSFKCLLVETNRGQILDDENDDDETLTNDKPTQVALCASSDYRH